MKHIDACMSDHPQEEAPGNKVLLAVSRSFGNCSQCGMLFPDRARIGPIRKTPRKPFRMYEDESRKAPEGVYYDENDSEGRTWYHVPNFGRKFFDALRKYYTVQENGREIRVAIKRPEKDSFCTWIGIVGHPRNYSTGGKRSRLSEAYSPSPACERGRAGSMSTEECDSGSDGQSSDMGGLIGGGLSTPYQVRRCGQSSTCPPSASCSWSTAYANAYSSAPTSFPTPLQPQICSQPASSVFSASIPPYSGCTSPDEFASPNELDSPLTRACMRNKNACMIKMNAIDWFPDNSRMAFI